MTNINIVLIIGLINYILYFLKGNNGLLSCGIIAYAGKNVEDFNADKFSILGIMNETRGKHSCGVSVDGTIRYGTGGQKLYRDFVSLHRDYLNPTKIPIVIGHTRWATGGAHNEANAHPFGFGEGDKFDFIGVHNGSLHNEGILAKKYNVNQNLRIVSNLKNGQELITYRNKIDSEILLEIIHNQDDFKVLNDYNGAAALVFYNIKEPNVVYCYHGSSKKSRYVPNDVEERPLFYYKESKNSLYISSIEDSLFSIGAELDTIGEFLHNKVYKITDGDVDNAVIFDVDRSKEIQTFDYQYKNYHAINNAVSTVNNKYDLSSNKGSTSRRAARKAAEKERRNRKKAGTTSVEINIHNEIPVSNVNNYRGRIYFNKFRFYRNGHLINGIYTFIKGFGYYWLDESDTKAAVESFYRITNKEFFQGDFVKDTTSLTKDSFIPFPHGVDGKEITNPPLYYFIEGIQLKTDLDFMQIGTFIQDGDMKLDTTRLSWASKHPIIDISKNNVHHSEQNIKKDGSLYTGIYCMLGSDKIYKVHEGNLVNTILTKNAATLPMKNSTPNEKQVVNEANKIALLDIIRKDIENKPTINFTNELVRADLDKMLVNFYISLPSFISQLEKYGDNKIANDSIEILKSVEKKLGTIATLQID